MSVPIDFVSSERCSVGVEMELEVVDRASPAASLSSAKVTATSDSTTRVSRDAARSTAWVPPWAPPGLSITEVLVTLDRPSLSGPVCR